MSDDFARLACGDYPAPCNCDNPRTHDRDSTELFNRTQERWTVAFVLDGLYHDLMFTSEIGGARLVVATAHKEGVHLSECNEGLAVVGAAEAALVRDRMAREARGW